MNILAFDFETELIADRTTQQHGNMDVKTSPYVTPRVVLGSYAMLYENGDSMVGVQSPEAMAELLGTYLALPDFIIVGHNIPFDIDVICAAFPELHHPFIGAHAAGRVYDTKTLDILARIASGYFDKPQQALNWAKPQVKARSLRDLAMDYLGQDLAKDLVDADGDSVRLSFAKYLGKPLSAVPKVALDYALEDSVVTLKVFQRIMELPGAPWSGVLETRMAWVVHEMDKKGMAVDRAEARRLHDLFAADLPALKDAVVDAGFARWEKATGVLREKIPLATAPAAEPWSRRGETMVCVKHYKAHAVRSTAPAKFTLNYSELRAGLQALADEQGLTDADLKFSEGGLLSASVDEWADRIPSESPLQHWARYAKLEKILGTYLRLYSTVDHIYPRWNAIGAVTSRMSASNPSIQNIPKRRWGIRSLFVPQSGNMFVISDYAAQELYTLAQAMLDMGIKGNLFKGIQGGDLHTSTARLIKGIDITWLNNISHLLLAFYGAVESLSVAAGSTQDESAEDTEKCLSVAKDLLSRVWPSDFGSEQFQKICLSAIPVTTLRALIQNTSFSEQQKTIAEIWLRKVELKGAHHTILDLLHLIGREGFLSILQPICERGGWPILTGSNKSTSETERSIEKNATLLREHGSKLIQTIAASIAPVSKDERQASKALGFGCPGGLGPSKLADYGRKNYGVQWTIEQAAEVRNRFLEVYPDIAEYLRRHKTDFRRDLLGVSGKSVEHWLAYTETKTLKDLRKAMAKSPEVECRKALYAAERQLTISTRAGYVRKGCRFTEGSNARFQSLAAAVTKAACWLLFAKGYVPTAVVHDEIVLESAPEEAEQVKRDLEESMLQAFREVCPDTGAYAKVETTIAERWGKATNAMGQPV